MWNTFNPSSLVMMKDTGVAAGGWLLFSALIVTLSSLTSEPSWTSVSFSLGIAVCNFLADVESAITVHCVCLYSSETRAWSR